MTTAETGSFEDTHNPVNSGPFNALRMRFSEGVIEKDEGLLHLVEIDAKRLRRLLQNEVDAYDNMVEQCTAETERIKAERVGDSNGN